MLQHVAHARERERERERKREGENGESNIHFPRQLACVTSEMFGQRRAKCRRVDQRFVGGHAVNPHAAVVRNELPLLAEGRTSDFASVAARATKRIERSFDPSIIPES